VGDKLSVALSLILEIIPLINVLLVDDHELVRAGIRRILEDIKGIKVAGGLLRRGCREMVPG
jgi:two-component system invasion response regulator UvrY